MNLTTNASQTFNLTYWIQDVVKSIVDPKQIVNLKASGRGINVLRFDFMKTNLEGLQERLGDFEGLDARFMSAVKELVHQINKIIICSNGAGVGYASNQRKLLEVTPLAITGANSVGAGDAAVAGFVAAESGGSDFITSVKTAKAWARKACQNPGSAGLKSPFDSTHGASVRLLKSQSLSS